MSLPLPVTGKVTLGLEYSLSKGFTTMRESTMPSLTFTHPSLQGSLTATASSVEILQMFLSSLVRSSEAVGGSISEYPKKTVLSRQEEWAAISNSEDRK